MFIKLDPPLPQQRYTRTLPEVLTAVAELLTRHQPLDTPALHTARTVHQVTRVEFHILETLGLSLQPRRQRLLSGSNSCCYNRRTFSQLPLRSLLVVRMTLPKPMFSASPSLRALRPAKSEHRLGSSFPLYCGSRWALLHCGERASAAGHCSFLLARAGPSTIFCVAPSVAMLPKVCLVLSRTFFFLSVLATVALNLLQACMSLPPKKTEELNLHGRALQAVKFVTPAAQAFEENSLLTF